MLNPGRQAVLVWKSHITISDIVEHMQMIAVAQKSLNRMTIVIYFQIGDNFVVKSKLLETTLVLGHDHSLNRLTKIKSAAITAGEADSHFTVGGQSCLGPASVTDVNG